MPYKNKEDQRACQRQWYKDNKAKAKKWTADAKARKQEAYLAYKVTLKCQVCNESESACLDFHHLDPSLKDGIISQKAKMWSLDKLKNEIAKCVVLCANCHRKVHAGVINPSLVHRIEHYTTNVEEKV